MLVSCPRSKDEHTKHAENKITQDLHQRQGFHHSSSSSAECDRGERVLVELLLKLLIVNSLVLSVRHPLPESQQLSLFLARPAGIEPASRGSKPRRLSITP